MNYETSLLIESWILIGVSCALLILVCIWIVSVVVENIRDRKYTRSLTFTREFEQQTKQKLEELTTKCELLSQRLKRIENDQKGKG